MLFLVKTDVTRRSELYRALEQLQNVKANLIGVVINGIPPHMDPYGYYGYYGYYQEEPVEKKPKKKKKVKKKKRYEEDNDDFDLGFDKEKAYEDF